MVTRWRHFVATLEKCCGIWIGYTTEEFDVSMWVGYHIVYDSNITDVAELKTWQSHNQWHFDEDTSMDGRFAAHNKTSIRLARFRFRIISWTGTQTCPDSNHIP